MELRDKVVVITGGLQGLGYATAKHLIAGGARIAILDMAESHSTQVTQSLNELSDFANLHHESGDVCYTQCNVSDEASVVEGFSRIMHTYKRIDVLVNNAGITRDGLTLKVDRETGLVIDEMPLANFQQVLDVNLTGTFLCAREAAKYMINGKEGGVVINISSVCRTGNKGQANYSATKAGVVALMECWCKEWVNYGIRVNAVAPGYIATDMVMAIPQKVRDKIAAGIPQQRLGEPVEIAQAVHDIICNDYLNGTVIEVNGGLRI